MKHSNRSPSYLIRNDHSYCFRMIVPQDLHRLTGKKELRFSLKTGYVGIAKTKARFLAGQVQMIFRVLRKGGTALSKLSDDKIKELVEQHIKRAVKLVDKTLYAPTESDYDDHLRQLFLAQMSDLNEIREDLICNLAEGDYSMLEEPISRLLEENGGKQSTLVRDRTRETV